MRGENPISKQNLRKDGALLVKSIFYTLQGEGPDSGKPSIFIRLAGCNLRCWFCDTDFDGGRLKSVAEIYDRVSSLSSGFDCRLVCITGGEPLLQNVVPLITRLAEDGVQVSIETAGTVFVPGIELLNNVQIVCSPKTPELDHRLVPHITAYKYLLKSGCVDSDGLPSTLDKSRVYRQKSGSVVPVYVQPMDEGCAKANAANLETCVMSCLDNGHYLSIQVHKIADVE